MKFCEWTDLGHMPPCDWEDEVGEGHTNLNPRAHITYRKEVCKEGILDRQRSEISSERLF